MGRGGWEGAKEEQRARARWDGASGCCPAAPAGDEVAVGLVVPPVRVQDSSERVRPSQSLFRFRASL